MKKQEFKILIDAPKEKVWETLWHKKSYEEWTAVFAEGSTAETDWKKGSRVLFLDGKGSGMFSVINDNIPNEYMSIKHLGIVKDGVEEVNGDWAGALENYTLKNVDGKTEVKIDIDITDDFADYMENTWPKALDKLKSIAEQN